MHHFSGGMILVNTCEDPFGDLYPKGVWGEFRKRVSSEISRNVVALASFKGDFAVMCYLLFHICVWSSFADDQNRGVQEKQGFLHALEFLLTMMMSIRKFLLQQA